MITTLGKVNTDILMGKATHLGLQCEATMKKKELIEAIVKHEEAQLQRRNADDFKAKRAKLGDDESKGAEERAIKDALASANREYAHLQSVKRWMPQELDCSHKSQLMCSFA